MHSLEDFLNQTSDIVWGPVMLALLLGIALTGMAMEAHDPHGFAWAMFGFFAAYLALAAWRAMARPPA